MKYVYCIFQVAVYRHSCFGVFSTEECAIAAAREVAAGDFDSHHDYEVVRFEVDTLLGRQAGHLSNDAKEGDPIFETSKDREATP